MAATIPGMTTRLPADAGLPRPTGMAMPALVWLAGLIVFFGGQIVAGQAWQPGYSWTRFDISDLGAVACGPPSDGAGFACSPLHDLMNACFAITGVLIVAGVLLSQRAWGRSLWAVAARVLLLLTGAAYVLVAREPEDVNLNLHVLGAAVILFLGNGGILLAGLVGASAPLAQIRGWSIALGILGLIGTLLFLGHHYLFVGMGGMERVAVYPPAAWMLIAALGVLIPAGAPRRTDPAAA